LNHSNSNHSDSFVEPGANDSKSVYEPLFIHVPSEKELARVLLRRLVGIGIPIVIIDRTDDGASVVDDEPHQTPLVRSIRSLSFDSHGKVYGPEDVKLVNLKPLVVCHLTLPLLPESCRAKLTPLCSLIEHSHQQNQILDNMESCLSFMSGLGKCSSKNSPHASTLNSGRSSHVLTTDTINL